MIETSFKKIFQEKDYIIMGGNNKEALQRENTIRFIEAAEELIDEHGIDNVSVRKIAEKAGFHNSTIYLYFKDVNELILLASMKHFNEYSKALARLSSKNWDSTENFYFVWRFFVESMLKNPKIYYNFFFGKHGQDFGSLFKRYYELFPEEADKLSPDLMDMYYGKNIQERCMKLLLTIKDKDNQLTSKNINMINTIIVASVKYILEQKCMEPELDSDILTRDLMNIIEYTLSK